MSKVIVFTNLTLFRPATGEVRAKGVTSTVNAILHPWLKSELKAVLHEWAAEHPVVPMDEARPPLAQRETWLGHPPRGIYPPIRLILVWVISPWEKSPKGL